MTDKPDSLAAALAEVQTKLPEIGKDKTARITSEKGSYTYSYANLASISRAVLPLLGAVGLSWLAKPTMKDGRFVLVYKLMHTSGEAEEGEYPLPGPNGVTAQQTGSAITYARRYALISMLGVAPDEDDDDGAAASQAKPQEAPAQRPEPTKALIRQWVDQIYQARDQQALRRVWIGVEASRMQDAEAIDHEGNPATLSQLIKQRKTELPEAEAEPDAPS
jgi:ERF superfamily